MLLLATVFGIFSLACVMAAAVLGTVAAICLLLLAMMGVVSASVLVGLGRRSVSDGLRCFFAGSLTLAGTLIGLLLAAWAMKLQLNLRTLPFLASGAALGALGAFLSALLADFTFRVACRWAGRVRVPCTTWVQKGPAPSGTGSPQIERLPDPDP